ncbi:MAG: TonB-dependent receptor [Bacteroidales bacterium]|nr:TonB-dependent receptor [Bacteroidales bacterium]
MKKTIKLFGAKLVMMLVMMFTVQVALAQGKISGSVVDATGEPVTGASIVVVGTLNGTVSDIDGNFSINVKSDDMLQISYIGYVTQTVKPVNGMTVTLAEDNEMIDEVVVVGYGVQRKSDLTGAVAKVDGKTLEERPMANIVQALQGAVPGLNISVTGTNAEGSSSQTRIRGEKSISADNKPLIILDGIPFDGPWSEINPNDVASVEVLKDASSAAIYGARGSNGVILITTKKGDKGKLNVSYSANFTVNKAVIVPRLMTGQEFWDAKIDALKAANVIDPTPSNPEPWMGNITMTEQRLHDAGLETDWLDLALRTAFSQHHNLSFRGGVNKTSYYVSFNLADNEGIAVGNNFQRVNLRVNLDQEFTDWLKFSTNTQLGRFDRSGSNASFSRAFKMNPLAEAYNEDGSIRSTAWEDSSEAFCVNPLDALNNRTRDIRYKVVTNNALDIKIPWIKGLTYRLNTGFTYENSSWKQYQGLDTYYGARANGIINTDDWHSEEWIIENIVSYNREFGKHRLFLTGLYSAQSKEYEQNTMEGKDFPNDVMYYYQMSKASTSSGSSSYWKVNHLSQMFRINYTYDSRYLLTLTARRDGYSAFGADSKFGVFPSMALGWNVMNEKFFKSALDVMNNLKLRLSWGKNGNEAISAYSSLPNLSTYNYLNDDHTAMYGFFPEKLASPTLGWETTQQVNFGVDFAFLNNRISGTFDTYWSHTKDLLLNRSIPTINGTGNITENRGKTKGSGWELQINSTNIVKKNFTWTTTLNLAHYNTEIVDVGIYDENGNPVDDVASRWFIGEPISVNYDYKKIGIWQIADASNPKGQQDPNYRYSIPGYVKVEDKDGQNDITPDDMQLIGSAVPWLIASLSNSLSYKGLTLTVFLNSEFGRSANNTLMTVYSNSYRQNRLYHDFWTPENPTNDYPMNSLDAGPNPYDAGFYEDAWFVRLQNVNLSYNLPSTWLKKIKLSRVQVYVDGKNLKVWTPWKGLDPEYTSNQQSTPPQRSISFGLKIDL